ncbi:MAG: hypothetical protein ACTHJ0_11305 [Flavipsychrobacter sp.]
MLLSINNSNAAAINTTTVKKAYSNHVVNNDILIKNLFFAGILLCLVLVVFI